MGWKKERKNRADDFGEKQRKRRKEYRRQLCGASLLLLAVAAAAFWAASCLLPVVRVYSSSMEPGLQKGDVAVLGTWFSPKRGDVVSIESGGQLLLRRVIALPGDTVNLDEEGTVFVNGEELPEPYLEEKSLGQCDISLPFQVPQGEYFVLGDNRESAVDSRSTALGCVDEGQVEGRLILRIFPLNRIRIF